MSGAIYLLITTVLAAIGWAASKLVVAEMPGDSFIAARFLLAGLLLLPACYKQLSGLTRKQLLAVISVGLVMSTSLQVWVHAVSITGSLSEGAFIMSLAMMIAPLTSWLLFRIRPNRAFWQALPVAIIGLMLLTLHDGWRLAPSQLLFLCASALLSIHFVLNKRLTTSINPLLSICIQLLVVGISGQLFIQLTPHPAYQLSNQALLWFIIASVAATAIRFYTQTLGQSLLKLETASLIMLLEPVWTLLLSLTLLDEAVHPLSLLGGLVILLSLLIFRKQSPTSHTASVQAKQLTTRL